MTLDAWLTANSLTCTAFAKRAGFPVQTVWNWLSGRRIPSRDQMARLHQATDREVGPQDFYDLDAPGSSPSGYAPANPEPEC